MEIIPLADEPQAAGTAAAPNPAEQSPPVAVDQAQAAPLDGQIIPPEPELDEDGDEKVDITKPLSKSQLRRIQRKAEFESLKEENARLRQQLPPPGPRPNRTVEDLIGPPPNPQNYRDVASYNAAVAAWDINRGVATRQLAADKAADTERENARQNALARSYSEKQAKARQRLPDYDKVVAAAAGIEVRPAVSAAIIESDLAPELEYHLAANPAKLHALNNMRPEQVAREIGRLEAVLGTTPQARTATQAPPPVSPLRGGAAGPARSLADLAKGDDATDYIAQRRAERAKQRA